MPDTDRAVAALKAAKNIVFITGAGTSAERGIPTLRDKLTGIWSRVRDDNCEMPCPQDGSGGLIVDLTSDLGESINLIFGDSLSIELVGGSVALKPIFDGGTKCWIRCRRTERRHGILRHRNALTSQLQRLTSLTANQSGMTGMNTKEIENVKAAARAKLKKIQQSAGYKSFFNDSAIETFGRVEATAFAGRPLSGKT